MTTTLGLIQPTVGSTSWGGTMNTNMGSIDTGTAFGQINLYSPIAISGATALTTTAFGRIHELSGTSSAYGVTLPPASAANIGSMIAFRGLPNASLNQVVTVTCNGTDVMDGIGSLAMLWDEMLVVLCVASGVWTKVVWKTLNRWQAFVPTINAVTTNPTKGTTRVETCFWSRDGSDLLINFYYEQNSAGTAGSGTYRFMIPGGFSIDTTRIVAAPDTGPTNRASCVGMGILTDAAATWVALIRAYDATSLSIMLISDTSTGSGVGAISSGFSSLANGAWAPRFTARVPIAGWG